MRPIAAVAVDGYVHRPGGGGKPARRGWVCRPAAGRATGRKLLQGARPAPLQPRTCSRRRTRRPESTNQFKISGAFDRSFSCKPVPGVI